jgi:hypothetical protein
MVADALNAEKMYQALASGAKAMAAWREMLANGFANADGSTDDSQAAAKLKVGNPAALAAVKAFDDGTSGDNASKFDSELLRKAADQASVAEKSYTAALLQSWMDYASACRDNAAAQQKAALAIKADIACKDQYETANTVMKNADAAYAVQNYRDAAADYVSAGYSFAGVAVVAQGKRDAALAAIQAAQNQAKDAEAVINNASQVETLAPAKGGPDK